MLNTWLGSIIAIFAFILYAQSINHDYTLDDHRVIDENTVTKSGIAGIPDILKNRLLVWIGAGLLRSKGDTAKANEYMNMAMSLGYRGQP